MQWKGKDSLKLISSVNNTIPYAENKWPLMHSPSSEDSATLSDWLKRRRNILSVNLEFPTETGEADIHCVFVNFIDSVCCWVIWY